MSQEWAGLDFELNISISFRSENVFEQTHNPSHVFATRQIWNVEKFWKNWHWKKVRHDLHLRKNKKLKGLKLLLALSFLH